MLKFYIQLNFKSTCVLSAKDEAKLACKFYDGKGKKDNFSIVKNVCSKVKIMIIQFMFNTQVNLIKNVKNVIKILTCLNNNFFVLNI